MTQNRNTYLGWGLTAVELALVAVIGFLLIRALITFTNPQSVYKPVIGGPAEAHLASSSGPAAVDLSFDPFHRTETVIVEVAPSIGEDAPETTLNLKMVGRVVPVTAILRTPDGQEKSYKIGDEILNGVTLESVTARYIVLSQNGRLERLTFDDGETTGLKAVPTAATNSALVSPQSFMSAVQLTPVAENGQPQGVRITPRRADFDLGAFKLQSGDIITHFGGLDLRQGTPSISRLSSTLSGSGSIQIKLIRNGQSETVELKL